MRPKLLQDALACLTDAERDTVARFERELAGTAYEPFPRDEVDECLEQARLGRVNARMEGGDVRDLGYALILTRVWMRCDAGTSRPIMDRVTADASAHLAA